MERMDALAKKNIDFMIGNINELTNPNSRAYMQLKEALSAMRVGGKKYSPNPRVGQHDDPYAALLQEVSESVDNRIKSKENLSATDLEEIMEKLQKLKMPALIISGGL